MDVPSLLSNLSVDRPAALARAISIVENGRPGFEELLSALHPRLGQAHRIGVTGPPGAGKSTLTQQLVAAYRKQGLPVAVVAIDPTSPFTGGALLGDRIRMEPSTLDEGVYIRSMATRGSVGGLATSTSEVCDVLDAAGFARILIETVGVGQSELDIATMADSTALVLVPESGDGIQTLKSGVMEIADLFVVNKADRAGADKLAREIDISLGIRTGHAFRGIKAHHGVRLDRRPASREVESDGKAAWEPPVLLATASKGEGIEAIVAAFDRHHEWMTSSGELGQRRRRRLSMKTRAIVRRAIDRWVWHETSVPAAVDERLDDMVAARATPYEVAADIVAGLKEGVRA